MGLICFVCLFFVNLESLIMYDWVDKGMLVIWFFYFLIECFYWKNGKEIY